MAPSSGGLYPYARFWTRQQRLMEQHLHEHLRVSPFLTLSSQSKFLIEGDQGRLRLPRVCCEGASQTYRKTVQQLCRAILASLHTRKLHRDCCLKKWFLWACVHGVPVSVCWLAGCTNGILELSEHDWSSADHGSAMQVPGEVSQQAPCQLDAVSTHLLIEQHVQHDHLVDHKPVVSAHASQGNVQDRLPYSGQSRISALGTASLKESSNEFNRMPNYSLLGALLQFGMPPVDENKCKQPSRVEVPEILFAKHRNMKPACGPELSGGQVSQCKPLQVKPGRAQTYGQPPQPQGAKLVGCGDALVPYLYTAVASLQGCFAYLCGTKVGEASHPGPERGKPSAAAQVKHDPSTGVRVGEASNPGPSPFGPELENMIKQYVMEAVREAIKDAFMSLGISAPASSGQTVDVPQGGQQAGSTSADKPGKGSLKGKSKPQASPPCDKDRGKGRDGNATKPLVPLTQVNPPNPPTSSTPNKRGKGRGQAAENEWKVVTRQPKAGEFQLRSQDWNAPVVPFNKLSAAIDATEANAVLEGVMLADKQEVEHAKMMLQGSKAQYKFLLIYLAKEEKSQKIPGRIQDQLCFRDAIVLQCHSSDVSQSPTPAGLANAPIKVAPLQSIAVYVRVPKQYASDQLWSSFCKNASKTIATWAADRHVQPLDSFNWAEEKQRTGGQELQVFGIMRIPKKDLSTLLAVSGQLGVFIEPCRSQAPRIKITWIERVKGENATQYLTRANQHGAAFGLAVHGGRLGWRLAAQPDELLPRVWTLPWLPMHWDDDAVKQLLSSEFKDIALLTHRRNRGNLSYRFRATCLKGDKDLVALLAETDTGPLTLWASVAPARTLQKSQRKLPQGAVPVVLPKERSTAFPTTSKAMSEPEVGADGKPVPGAKRTKCDVRTVPDDLKTIEMAKDGNCIYRAVAEGLAWLSGGKLRVEHREVRAKAIAHLQKHKTAYFAQWDGESPSGDPMQSFDDYLAASARDCSYGSPLEVEALARVFDVQIVVIPYMADFAVMSFRTSQAKRVLVLWYQDRHVDLLVPKADTKKYPEAVLRITTGPVHKLRAGGPRSTCSRASQSASEWTIGARSSVSLLSPKHGSKKGKGVDTLDSFSVWSRAPSDASLRNQTAMTSEAKAKNACNSSDRTRQRLASGGSGDKGKVVFSGRSNRRGEAKPASLTPSTPPRPISQVGNNNHAAQVTASTSCKRKLTKTASDASQDLSGCSDERPAKRIYRAVDCRRDEPAFPVKCPLCPYKTSVSTFKAVRQQLRGHYKKHHRDAVLPAPSARRKASYQNLVRVQDDKAQVHWKCPLCPMAMLKEDADQMCESSVAKHKNQHKRTHHPKTRWTTWRKLDYESRAAKVVRTKLFARTSNSLEEITEMQDLGFDFLWWPRARGYCKNLKQQSSYIARMHPTWVCKQCGNTFKAKKEAITHAERICPFSHPKSALSMKWCRSLLRHRIRVLAKLRDKYVASAPESDRRSCDLVLFDKALDHFGGFSF